MKCKTCERRTRNGCKVMIKRFKECWAWTDDPEWEEKVNKATEEYKHAYITGMRTSLQELVR